MYGAKCLTVLIVLVGLAVMWFLSRKKTNQVMLAIAATILIGGVLRLFQLKSTDESIYTIGAIFAVMAVVWLVSWASNRAAIGKKASEPPRGRQGR